MLDTKSLKLEKDTDGKVSLSEVIDLLKELHHEVHCSVQQIKTEKAQKNRQKLYGIPKSSQLNRGSHLRLISRNDRSNQELQNTYEVSAMGFQHQARENTPATETTLKQATNIAELNLNHAVPEMEELQEIIGLLDKLEE